MTFTADLCLYLEPAFFNVWEYGWLSNFAKNNCTKAVKIPYPNTPSNFNATTGMNNLDMWLRNAGSQTVIVVGHSEGSQVACKWLREIAPTSSVSPARVQFVLTGNPERRYGGSIGMMQGAPKTILQQPGWTGGVWFPPSMSIAAYASHTGEFPGVPLDTPFSVFDLARQYDHYADYPSSSTSVSTAASQNASTKIHMNYWNVNVNDSDIVTHAEGNITWAWKPTYPTTTAASLTDPTQQLAADRAARSAIEACYQRPVTLPTP